MYDALLALRGWGVDEFRLASPLLHLTARWALFAERMAPSWKAAREQLAVTVPSGTSTEERNRIEAARLRAAAELDELRPLLLPQAD